MVSGQGQGQGSGQGSASASGQGSGSEEATHATVGSELIGGRQPRDLPSFVHGEPLGRLLGVGLGLGLGSVVRVGVTAAIGVLFSGPAA